MSREYRVELHHYNDELHEYRTPAEEILWFTREGMSQRDWENITLALRAALRDNDDSVHAEIYVDGCYYMIATIWREKMDPAKLHLDVVRAGKYREIRVFREVNRDAA